MAPFFFGFWRCTTQLQTIDPKFLGQKPARQPHREVKEGAQGNAFEQAGVPMMESKPVDTSPESWWSSDLQNSLIYKLYPIYVPKW